MFKHIVMESAQRALDGGVDLADKTWLTIENGKVQSMDFAAYVKDITRMKTAPASMRWIWKARRMICLEMR